MRTLAELIPLRTAACRDAVDAVAVVAAGEPDADPRQAEHIVTCLRCQAEVAAFRRVLATMRTMRDGEMLIPCDGPDQTIESIHEDDAVPSTWAVRAAYVGGITAAGAGVIVWLTRRRPGLLSAS